MKTIVLCLFLIVFMISCSEKSVSPKDEPAENRVPEFTDEYHLWTHYVEAGNTYMQVLHASDRDGDALMFAKLDGPDSLSISDSTISWITSINDTGTVVTISVEVRDGEGGTDTLSWELIVYNDVVAPTGMQFIPGGTYYMGSNYGNQNEAPKHEVTLSPFFIDEKEVTQNYYESLMGVNPSSSDRGDELPVIDVNWYNAVLFCNERSKADGYDTVYQYQDVINANACYYCVELESLTVDFSKNGYRLPTEAQWEFVARSGYKGDVYPDIDQYAWHFGNASMTLRQVGTKASNVLGIYDIFGNACEWCNDWYGSDYYNSSPVNDPAGPSSGTRKVIRGGDVVTVVGSIGEVAKRYSGTPTGVGGTCGIRCVLPYNN